MFIGLLSAFFSWLFLRVLIPQLRLRLIDTPNNRSSHLQPTPRGGGIVFVTVSLLFSFLSLLKGDGGSLVVLPLFSAPLAFVGLFDDRHNLPASLRYVFQLLTGLLLIFFSPLLHPVALFSERHIWLLLPVCLFLLFVITAVINFINFMDGLDGLVAGCMAVSISAISVDLIAPWSLWALVGSLLGFLIWNWSPARVFMGDVGSTFLGAIFAGLVLQASSWTSAFGYLLVATPLLVDACICVIRRLFDGQPIFQAHRLHLYQRLHQAGWSHSRVSITYISATALLALSMIFGGLPLALGLAVVEVFLGAWLDQRFAVSFVFASKS